jgi:hypothetical protein
MPERTESQHSEASPQHTPGPWRVVSSVYVDDVYGPDGDMLASVLSPADPDVTAHMNAGIIGAAPDLLAALKSLLACVDATEDERWPIIRITRPMVEILDGLVAKAEGRQP